MTLLPVPLWSGVVSPVSVRQLGQIKLFNDLLYLKLFNYVQINDEYWIELSVFNSNTWKHLSVRQEISCSSFKYITF